MTWILSNSEKAAPESCFKGDGRDRLNSCRRWVKMAAIYTKNSTTWMNVTAKALMATV